MLSLPVFLPGDPDKLSSCLKPNGHQVKLVSVKCLRIKGTNNHAKAFFHYYLKRYQVFIELNGI